MRTLRMLLVLAVAVATVAFASGVPKILQYQGKLTDAEGVALDGDHDIVFRIYDASTGGTALWEEEHTSSTGHPVTIVNGLFDVTLGEITDLNIAFDDTYWIELEVDGEVLSPREMLVAVPYAFRAVVADTAYVVGSGAVQTDGTSITGDGTETNPLSAVLGNSIESSEITDGTITNDDISTSAGIEWSKLATGTANRLIMTDGSGNLTVVGAPTANYYLKWDGSDYVWSATTADMADHIAGNGLTGGNYNGSSDVTWSVVAGQGIVVDGSGVSVKAGNGISVDASGVSVIYGSSANTAVEGNTTITINAGTGLSGGATITLGAGGSVTLTNTDRGSSQNIFKQVQDASGTTQFSASSNNDYIQFAGTGGASISFDATYHRVIIDASGASDDWGDQVAEVSSPITGDGTSGSPLSLSYGNGLTVSSGALIVNAGDGLGFSGSQLVNTGVTSITAGTGINVSAGTGDITITNTGDTDASDDITNSTSAGGDLSGTYPSPTVVGLQGNPVSSTAPSTGYVLKWSGSAWAPAEDDNTTYSAGQGLTLSGTTFSANVDGMTIEIGSDGKIRQGNGAVKASSTNYRLYRNY